LQSNYTLSIRPHMCRRTLLSSIRGLRGNRRCQRKRRDYHPGWGAEGRYRVALVSPSRCRKKERRTPPAEEISVGRKSGAPSAAPKARAYSRYAGLSPQSGSGRNLFLYSEPARPRCGSIGDANRHIAQRGSRVRAGTPLRIDAWFVLPDHMHCLRTLPQGDAGFPGRWSTIKTASVKCLPTGESRSPVMTSRGERGIWQRRLLGAHDTPRSGLCGSHGRHAFQPGETRSRGAPGALAAFVVSSVRGWRTLPRRVARRQ
jgi:REP element-mobilizing transposase RayT